jgi:hypothetical protein
MGEVINFPHRVEVELEQEDGQSLLEAGIVMLWELIGGNSLKDKIDHDAYLYLFLQYSGVCFDCMENELIVVDEDGNLGIESETKAALVDAINDIERELATKH